MYEQSALLLARRCAPLDQPSIFDWDHVSGIFLHTILTSRLNSGAQILHAVDCTYFPSSIFMQQEKFGNSEISTSERSVTLSFDSPKDSQPTDQHTKPSHCNVFVSVSP